MTNICSILSKILSPEENEKIIWVTDTSKVAEYQKSKHHLKESFNNWKIKNRNIYR